jgi:hypothetical protein
MTKEERQLLLELKAFLLKAIEQTEDDLITFPVDGTRDDYDFLIAKAVMYRENFKQITEQLKADIDDE